jgi:hypothetical protein
LNAFADGVQEAECEDSDGGRVARVRGRCHRVRRCGRRSQPGVGNAFTQRVPRR